MTSALAETFRFELPTALEAHEPPEARGLARDDVRLMITRMADDTILHTRFRSLPHHLNAGDVLVVNTSATINAALDAIRHTTPGIAEGIRLHLSTKLTDDLWVVELRRVAGSKTVPLSDGVTGERIELPAGGQATLLAPFRAHHPTAVRLWTARLALPVAAFPYTERYGSPIRYGYVPRKWPLANYQTIFATEPGSAEMPSAGRPFTLALLRRLERRGVRIATVVLHAGVASLEANEPPYPERFRVSPETAQTINDARTAGARIIAVGTTVVRALETAARSDGCVHAADGWTDLVVTPGRRLRIVDGMLTGLHEPRASHLAMLEALAGREHIARAYRAARHERYLWHEFGDLHLILPPAAES